jgi:uncharacterized protein YaaN involved in tellurite resistance
MDEKKIELTLTPDITITPISAPTPEKAANATVEQVTFDESTLSEAERKMINEFSEKIDLTNSAVILQYGSTAQSKIADFSDTALGNVRAMDLGEVGGLVTNLVVELQGFGIDEDNKGIMGFFKKTGSKITAMKAKYDKAEVNVDKICGVLEGHQDRLIKDVAVLDKLYQVNLQNFKELSMYIIAGKKKLDSARNIDLVGFVRRADETHLPEDAQTAHDFADLCSRFEKRIYDLELTRMVSIQMAPQIRLVQNNDTIMTEKIQSTIVNTIPLWKSQMVIALGLAHSQEALAAQRAVTDITNELLKKNAEALKLGTVETAREAERGVVDIETLQYTNESLISTLDEVLKIQDEGRERRRNAEIELRRIEGELRTKLLEIKK